MAENASLIPLSRLARQARLPVRALRRAVESGALRAYKLGDGPRARVLISPADLAGWLRTRAAAACKTEAAR